MLECWGGGDGKWWVLEINHGERTRLLVRSIESVSVLFKCWLVGKRSIVKRGCWQKVIKDNEADVTVTPLSYFQTPADLQREVGATCTDFDTIDFYELLEHITVTHTNTAWGLLAPRVLVLFEGWLFQPPRNYIVPEGMVAWSLWGVGYFFWRYPLRSHWILHPLFALFRSISLPPFSGCMSVWVRLIALMLCKQFDTYVKVKGQFVVVRWCVCGCVCVFVFNLVSNLNKTPT